MDTSSVGTASGIAAAALSGNPLAALGVGGSLSAPTSLTSGSNPITTINYGNLVLGGGAGSSTSASEGLPVPSSILGTSGTVATKTVYEGAAVALLIGFILWKKGVFHGAL